MGAVEDGLDEDEAEDMAADAALLAVAQAFQSAGMIAEYNAVYNMIGNVSEWVDSEYQPHAEGQRDKLKQDAIGMKINKGACYGSFTTDMRIAARYTMADAQNYEDLPYSSETDSAMGFRCAK